MKRSTAAVNTTRGELADLLRKLLARLWSWTTVFFAWLFDDYARELAYVAFVLVVGFIRRMGKTIDSGSTGLKFTLGRAGATCEAGFHPLVPLVQTIKVVPTRARTLDLPSQKLTTIDGLVFRVDANLVYRVVDVRKALIEIDDLQKGMLQMLGLGVNEVLRELDRARMRVSDELDRELAANLTRRLEPWGVVVERAAFTTIDPTLETTRITQLAARATERERVLAAFERSGVAPRADLALLGASTHFVRRARALRVRELERRQRRRWKRFETSLKSVLEEASVPHTDREFALRNARERFERTHVA